VADFLSDQWFEDVTARVNQARDAAWPVDARACVVVLEFVDAPAAAPHALTLSIAESGTRVSPGDSLAADAVVRLNYSDALAVTTGTLDSATALREGRIKVRGDVNVVVPLAGWLAQALAP